MNRLPACLALLAAPWLAIAAPGTGIERNETHTQIETRFLEKQKVCDSFQGAMREQCLDEARAARAAERAAAEKGHAEVAARREARDAVPGADRRASLQQAAEEELAVQKRIEMARCDAAPRAERDACRDVARARYGK